jgi:predicted RecB family nuclease
MSLSTVQKHVSVVCAYLKKPAPRTVSKLQIERGKKQLLAIRGITEPMLDKLSRADIIDAGSLLSADPAAAADISGIGRDKIAEFQRIARKKKDNTVIQL